MTHPHPKISFVPQAVLTRTDKINTAGVNVNIVGATVNTVRPVNTANTKAVNTVRSVNTIVSKPIANHPRTKTNAFKRGYSQRSSPFNRLFANKNNIVNKNVNTVWVKNTTARDRAVLTENKEKGDNAVKDSTCWGNPQQKEYKDKAVIDSGCSRHMTGNNCYLDEYKDYDGGFVSFGDGKGIISGKGKIKTGSLDFDDVYFCKELKYNLFSVSQIYDKKNNVLFTDTECLVLSSDFKLLDKSQVLLRVLRKDKIYCVDLKSVVPTGGLTYLIAKATIDESNSWYRRLGHINFKTMNKLMKGNFVKGLPLKIFENDHSCVACQKGKQHKASYKTKLVNSISKPLHMLHMDLFGPTNVKSLMKKSYCLVVTDDFSRFSWVFFLATKDETSGILKTFIIEIENQLDHKVKVIRSDNNGVAEKKYRTLIKDARTMLVDSKLPTTFWAEAVNTACYVHQMGLSRLRPSFKTPYERIRGRPLFAVGNKSNGIAGTKDNIDSEGDAGMKPTEVDENQASDKSRKHDQEARSESESTAGPSFDTTILSTPINIVGPSVSTANESEEQLFERFSPFKNTFTLPPVPNVSSMDNTGIFGNAYDDEDVKEEVDINNVISSYTVPDTSFTKFHKDHPED
ncbi:putative ribonuclease H-like domain-containing protein [Tanacetum coccineum]